ncbi:hypothetical protein [Duodenibacillus massiliensis]|uniref:hypothetical protein n=1 Tax=Duodenibacillus massiliensis TaxID=1852381 RepID=UPI00307A4B17
MRFSDEIRKTKRWANFGIFAEGFFAVQYITGVYVLNLPCSLETTGDWHSSALNWERPETADTEKSVFGAYGIEDCSFVPQHPVCKSGPTISGHFWISSRMVGSVRRVE